ncbi:helix-turn-helix domain-containing protein [Paenibacillus sp. NPDC058071]|uniref:helix-turn-helix domain-containing protein n=1 Tax=Paenibacillus sp. NPDC058071 TaxID=3346326 RepID=UPI0036DD5565
MKPVLQKTAAFYKPSGHLDPTGYERHVHFQTYLPPENLQPFICHFWIVSWEGIDKQPYVSEQVMHRPYVDIYLSLEESGIQCTFRDKRDYRAADSGRIIGARLLPGAFRAFWKDSLIGMHNETIELQRVFPEADQHFIEAALSQQDDAAVGILCELIQANLPVFDPHIETVNRIIEAIEAEDLSTVKNVAERFGKSERWLQQLFHDYVGVGIKWQLQRKKLLEAAKSIRENDNPSWADLAYEHGYSSQQHFITDFKRVLGKTPLQYKKELT